MGDKNRVGLIFLATIFIIPRPPSQSPQDPRIRDIESSSNIFGNLLLAVSNSQVPRLQWKGEGENRVQKNWKRRQGVQKTFKVWTRQVAWPSRQTSSRSD